MALSLGYILIRNGAVGFREPCAVPTESKPARLVEGSLCEALTPFLKGMDGRTGAEQMVERSEIATDEGAYYSGVG